MQSLLCLCARWIVPEGLKLSFQQSNVTSRRLHCAGSPGDPCHRPVGALHIPFSEPFPMVCEPHSIPTSLSQFQFLKHANTESFLNFLPRKKNSTLGGTLFSQNFFHFDSYSFCCLLDKTLSTYASISSQCSPSLPLILSLTLFLHILKTSEENLFFFSSLLKNMVKQW